VLHLADRLSDRGGAYRHLLAVLESLRGTHELLLAVGADEGTVGSPCRVQVVPSLTSRIRFPADLGPLVQGFRPDVIHLHNLMNPAVLEWAAEGPLAPGGRRLPALLTVQDHRYFCPSRGKWTLHGHACHEVLSPTVCASCFEDEGYFRDVLALTGERLAAACRLPLVVLSSYMKEELVAAGAPADRIRVIPPFVHGLSASAAVGPACVLFVGRLVEAKGVRHAVSAWRRSGVGLPLVFAGTGPLREELEGIAGVEVLGWVPHSRLASLYARARAVLMPSLWQEPFGIVGLEALAIGAPVVAYDSGGIREWHPGPGLVAWGDVDGLAAALREAVSRSAKPLPVLEPPRSANELVDLYRELTES
jgi:glycosyltransferase involved in cell wall biosynthesis